ncbi:hypothetical protein CEXT_472371 [Caerostris extrusa]|uniref:Uncharacterized protein n=1 Tax=Caerostris extrusa TaxID=172846 RepID=A0AAV4V9D8_CAEEX|nr:hypothetical protein CEXT_472371 [Caerostris extrusa]
MTQTFREIQPRVIESEKFTQPPVETLVVGSRTRPDGPHFIVPVTGWDSTSNMCRGLTEANFRVNFGMFRNFRTMELEGHG